MSDTKLIDSIFVPAVEGIIAAYVMAIFALLAFVMVRHAWRSVRKS